VSAEDVACQNTDRELWREREGDYYADSIHVTEQGGIGINCGGHVLVRTLREWHGLEARLAEVERDKQASLGAWSAAEARVRELEGALPTQDELDRAWKALRQMGFIEAASAMLHLRNALATSERARTDEAEEEK